MERLLVPLPVRARDWVVGSVPSWGRVGRQPTGVSLPPFPLSKAKTKKNKIEKTQVDNE